MKNRLFKAAGVTDDTELVRQAKAGSTHAYNELLRLHKDLLTRKASTFAKAAVPQAAVLGHAMKILRSVVDRFNPGQGVLFRTFLENNLRLTRFVNQYKNVARIPEHRALAITRFKNAKAILQANTAREPADVEIAESLGWSTSDVHAMEKAISRRDYAASSMEFDQVSGTTDRFKETSEFFYFGLTPEEKLVYDYSLGAHGKQQMGSVQAIATAAGLSGDRVYRVKRDIAKRLSQHR